MVKIPEIFKLLIKLINKNADFRLDEEDDTTQEKLKIMDEDEDFQNFSLDDDDDDDFWDEAYDDNYCSLLDDVDEISDFKNCIKKLAVEQPVFYQ